MRHYAIAIVFFLGMTVFGLAPVTHVQAQDALNLPTELYILLNEGRVERYGLGSSGRAFVTPEDAFVLDFQVAPDSVWIAYRTQEGLFIDNMYNATTAPIPIAGADVGIPYLRGQGETIAWSGDSSAIAFTTLTGGTVYFFEDESFATLDTPELVDLQWSPDGRYLATRAEGDIWWIYRRENNSMVLTSAITSGTSATWLDLTRLAFTPAGGGLVLMDMADANSQIVVLPPPQVYLLPRRIDDTTLLVFSLTQVVSSGILQGRLQRVALVDGEFQSEVVGENDTALDGVRWSPGNRVLTAFRGGVLALVDAFNGQGFTLPVTTASSYGWGAAYPPLTETLTLDDAFTYLALDTSGIQQIWQVAGDGTLPRTLTATTNDITEYAIAPNQRFLAYVSGGHLWQLSLTDNDAEPQRLIDLGATREVAPAFSPDGERIFFRDEQPVGAGIWFISTRGGDASLFVLDYDVARHYNPRPSLSVGAMVLTVRSPEPARNGILLVDTVSGEQAFLGNYTRAVWLNNGNLLVEGFLPRSDMPFTGLHVLDVNNLSEPPLTIFPLSDDLAVRDMRRIGANLRLLIQNRNPGRVSVLDVPLDGGTPIIVDNIGYITQPRISPDGNVIIGLTHDAGNLISIDLVTNTRQRLQDANLVRQLLWR